MPKEDMTVDPRFVREIASILKETDLTEIEVTNPGGETGNYKPDTTAAV